jgi:hypothetical protein
MIQHVRNWYARFERPISSLSLVGGFVFDALTLKRVDLFWENFWVVAHIVIVAVFIVLVNLEENESIDVKDPAKAHFWFVNILQFFFGGLLSTFLVFYFRSSTLSVTWPFMLILAAAFTANESLKKHYTRLVFQISLFYLSLFSFAIFIVPVLFGRIGPDVFVISGIAGLAALFIFLAILGSFAREEFKKSRGLLFLLILGIFFGTNVLYFSNLIPPIPISLKDGGIYHSLYRDTSGNYVVQFEDPGWLGYFSLHSDFHAVQGDPLYAYSAIFSPASFNMDIVHEWQEYDQNAGGWITMSRVNLNAVGGRDGGYRTYSLKSNITPGEWRVNIETAGGQIIGRLRFNVIAVDTEPILTTDIKS